MLILFLLTYLTYLTFDICTNTLFENTEKNMGSSKIKFIKVLSLATKESYFIFNRKLYKQIDRVPLSLTLTEEK